MTAWRIMVAAMAAGLWAAGSIGQQVGSGPAAEPAIPRINVNLGNLGYGTCDELFGVCDFTQQQKQRILALAHACQALQQENDKAIQPALEKLRKARANGDKDDPQAWQEVVRINLEWGPKLRESQAKVDAGILDLMTYQQKVKWRAHHILKQIKSEYAPAGLTDSQWGRIAEVCEQLAKDFSESSYRTVGRIKARMVDILTPQQKARFLLGRRPYCDMAKVCGLSDEQVQRLVKIEDAHARQLPEFQEEYEAKIADLKTAVASARGAGDEGAAQPLERQWLFMWDVLHTFNLINPNYSNEEVQPVLTEKQKTAWREYVKTQPDIMKKVLGGE